MRWRMIAGLVVGGLVAAGGFGVGLARGWWRMNHPSVSRFPVWGVDVSHHQGEIDWAVVARVPQIGFAYVKATEGGDWTDPRFAGNWQAARRAGLRVGGYHFFTFCRPALEQAQHFRTRLMTDSCGHRACGGASGFATSGENHGWPRRTHGPCGSSTLAPASPASRRSWTSTSSGEARSSCKSSDRQRA